ncbi:MAG: SDR family NAD(P)-dependent oxidoreductase [Phycisphaerales bacterium]
MNARRVAIVTGAGSGIGRAVAVELSRGGWSLVIAGRTREALSETARMCADPEKIEVVGCDCADAEQVRLLVARCVERFGRVDALVNNAGLGKVMTIAETTPRRLEETFAINALAVGWSMHYAWPVMVRQKSGCIVNVTSVAVMDPLPGFFAYASSKAAASMMAWCAAQEGREHGVRAFAVAPAAVETPMLRGIAGPEACLSPMEVARLVVECIEGKHDAHNGMTIPIVSDAVRGAWYEPYVAARPTGWVAPAHRADRTAQK